MELTVFGMATVSNPEQHSKRVLQFLWWSLWLQLVSKKHFISNSSDWLWDLDTLKVPTAEKCSLAMNITTSSNTEDSMSSRSPNRGSFLLLQSQRFCRLWAGVWGSWTPSGCVHWGCPPPLPPIAWGGVVGHWIRLKMLSWKWLIPFPLLFWWERRRDWEVRFSSFSR